MTCFHGPEDQLQRMINACLKGTYFVPHKSENPGKLKIFIPLRGRAAFLYFDDKGAITEIVTVDAKGPVRAVEIPPGTWCAPVILSDEAVFLEMVDGKYDPNTHKCFAPWAPREEDEGAAKLYLEKLKQKVEMHSTV